MIKKIEVVCTFPLKMLAPQAEYFCYTTFPLCLNCGHCVTTVLNELLFKFILLTQLCMHTILVTQDVFHL